VRCGRQYLALWAAGVTDGERERRAEIEERVRLRVRGRTS
jgi:hypothetical protein